MIVSMLTTVDNPFDPFEQFDEWFAFDEEKNNLVHNYLGCSCCELLDKKSFSCSEFPPIAALEENERAIDEIVNVYSMFHIFKKVQKEI